MIDVIEEQPTLKDIADFYGTEPQAHQLVEEMAELTQALNKLWRKTRLQNVNPVSDEACDLVLHVAEEIADVRICLEQVEYLLGVEEQTQEWREKKIKRQQDRLRQQGYCEGSRVGG